MARKVWGDVDRRQLLRVLGAGSLTAVAGCSSSPDPTPTQSESQGTPGGTDSEYMQAAEKMGFLDNWRERRIDITTDDWSMEARRDVPDRSDSSWEGYESFETAPWEPPEGWEDTIAGEVDKMQFLNHGGLTMEFDPATLATHELFEKKTGIEIEPIEIGIGEDQKEQAFLSSRSPSPAFFNVHGQIQALFTQRGWLEVTDPLYEDEVWDEYTPALQDLVQWDIDATRSGTHTYGYPNICEASLGNLRPDLMEEQGIDPSRFEGEWTWDLLEEAMEAFAGTGVYAFGFYGGTANYFSYTHRQMLYQQGGRLIQPDGTVRFDTDEGLTVIQKLAEWYQNGWIPKGAINFAEGDLADLFLSGQLAYTPSFSDLVPKALNTLEAGTEYKPILHPKATSGRSPEQASLVGPNSTAINSFAPPEKKAAALIYGDLRLSYPSQWWELTYEGNMSYMNKVYDDAANADLGVEYIDKYGNVLGNSIENGVFETFPFMMAAYERGMGSFQKAIVGDMAPEDAVGQVQTFVDDVFGQ